MRASLDYMAGMDGDSGTQPAGDLRFLKMHGLGNDFVVIDARGKAAPVTAGLARALGDRHRGVGFDQLAVLRDDAAADVAVEFWNSDGTRADACGNASRCVARLLAEETGRDRFALRTGRGVLATESAGNGRFRVNMGPPVLDWAGIPLAEDIPRDPLPIEGEPAAVGMGNPHCVFVVTDMEAIDLAGRGAEIERHPLFPERTNVEFVEVLDRGTLRMRVWERGGMVTLACGSGACAAVVVTASRGLTERCVTVRLDGGDLEIDWRDDGVWMTGPASRVFEGTLSSEFLAGLA
jgi:diaminopimelate epimerase